MATESKAKNKSLDLAISQIERQFGKGAIMKMNEAYQDENFRLRI